MILNNGKYPSTQVTLGNGFGRSQPFLEYPVFFGLRVLRSSLLIHFLLLGKSSRMTHVHFVWVQSNPCYIHSEIVLLLSPSGWPVCQTQTHSFSLPPRSSRGFKNGIHPLCLVPLILKSSGRIWGIWESRSEGRGPYSKGKYPLWALIPTDPPCLVESNTVHAIYLQFDSTTHAIIGFSYD